MKKVVIFTLLLSITIQIKINGQDTTDVYQVMLDSAGLGRQDIGYKVKGYWNRFPHDVPYRLDSFDDLFAEPWRVFDLGKIMGNAVRIYLSPGYLDSNSNALYKLTYSLGIDQKLGGFRSYSPNLLNITDSGAAMPEAFESLYGNTDIKQLPNDVKKELADFIRDTDDTTELIIARLIINLADIIRWRNLAFRNCPQNDIFDSKIIVHLSNDIMCNKYIPEFDNMAQLIDLRSLHYAALKSVAIVEETVDALKKCGGIDESKTYRFATPYGNILLLGKNIGQDSLDTINLFDALLTIDFGNSATFAGSSIINNYVSIFIDLGGDDTYRPARLHAESHSDSAYMPAQGAGIFGVGILYDADGDDKYFSDNLSQGAGLFGVGILFDCSGNDIYSSGLLSQGAGYFGIGLLIDAAGHDSSYCYGFGQGFGGHGGGVGILADFGGNDKYIGEPSPEIFDLSDYHSQHKINGNFVQGVGYGRRADLTDGHNWAGGLGAIIDIHGDDYYLSGNWSLGTGFWFATGVAVDQNGNDIYESCYFTQGSGAHFCNSLLLDENGNDIHKLYETAGAALGFGWDLANAFLININGDDSYNANMISIGCAEERSNAFLIDIGGNDIYRIKKQALAAGAVNYHSFYKQPADLMTYFTDIKSLGGFIDIGGNDSYISFDDSTEDRHPIARNNSLWHNPMKSDSTYGAGNFGIGLDIEQGVIPEIDRWRKDK